MDGIVCGPFALKLTVFGTVDVTLNVPEVSVNVPETPSNDPEPSCSDVPFSVTSARFAVPESVDVPVNVTVPVDAMSEPVTETFELTEKLRAVEIEPVMFSAEKESVPAPEIVFVEPLKVIVPELAVNVPAAERSPVISKEDVVETEPELTEKLLRMIPLPLSVFPVPFIVNVPLPAVCVNVPDPLVEKSPPTVRFVAAEAFNPDPVIVKLLKLYVPEPESDALFPESVIVLVPPVSVPAFVTVDENVWEKVPALNVAPAPMESMPVTDTFPPGTNVAVPEVERYPETVIAAVVVFDPLPLRTRFPYVFVRTFCAPAA